MPRITWLRSPRHRESPRSARSTHRVRHHDVTTPPKASTAAANASATLASEVTSPATNTSPAASGSRSKRTDGGSGRRERVGDRAADAPRGAGDEGDLALQLAGRGASERACTAQAASTRGREALVRVERDEAAERMGAGHDLDRATVMRSRESSAALVVGATPTRTTCWISTTRASGSAASALSATYRRVICSRNAAARSRIRSTSFAASSFAGSKGIHSGSRFVDEMIGTRGADRDQLRSRGRGDELPHAR